MCTTTYPLASIHLCQTQTQLGRRLSLRGEEKYGSNVTNGNSWQSWAETEFVPRVVETKVSATDSVDSRSASDSKVVLRVESCIVAKWWLGQIDCSVCSHLWCQITTVIRCTETPCCQNLSHSSVQQAQSGALGDTIDRHRPFISYLDENTKNVACVRISIPLSDIKSTDVWRGKAAFTHV